MVTKLTNFINWSNKLDRGIKIIFLLFLIFQFILLRPVLQKSDPVGYYSWVRSAIIGGDLNVSDIFEHFGIGSLLLINTKTANPAQPWAIGCSILWSPFFILAHLGVTAANYLGWSTPADGYTLPYLSLVSLGSTLYALIGLILIFQMIKSCYNSSIATISVVSIWLASPLVFYMYCHPMLSHANDMFAYSLLLWIWGRLRKSRKIWPDYLLLGAIAGLAALVRNQNAALAVLIIFYIIVEVARHGLTWRQGLLAASIFGVTWWLIFSPQLYVWHSTFGVWFLGNPYSLVGGGNFHFGFPWLFKVMFSDNRGLFIWNPILLFAVIGWVLLFHKDPALTIFLVASFFIQLGIIGSWDYWHGGNAFGQRFFVNLAPAFMFGFAALLDKGSVKIPHGIIIVTCIIFILWNILLIIQFAMGTVPRCGPADLWDLAQNQFLVIPGNFNRIISAWKHLK